MNLPNAIPRWAFCVTTFRRFLVSVVSNLAVDSVPRNGQIRCLWRPEVQGNPGSRSGLGFRVRLGRFLIADEGTFGIDPSFGPLHLASKPSAQTAPQ